MISAQWLRLLQEMDYTKVSKEFLAENVDQLLKTLLQKTEELKLHKSQSMHLEHALCQVSDAIIVADHQGDIRLSNPALQKELGWKKNFFQYWKQEPGLESLQAALSEFQEWEGILVDQKKGHRFKVQATMIQEADGHIDRNVFTITPVETELTLTERLTQQKDFLEKLLNLMEVSLLGLDDQGKLYLDNLAAKTLFSNLGKDGKAALLKRLHGLNPQEERLSFQAKGQEYLFLVRYQKIPLSYLQAPGKVGSLHLFTLSDITQFERMQKELFAKSQILGLEEISRQLARQEFIGGMMQRLSQSLNLAKAALVALKVHATPEQEVRMKWLEGPLSEIEQELKTSPGLASLRRLAGDCSGAELAKILQLLFGGRLEAAQVQFQIELSPKSPLYPLSQLGMLLLCRILLDNAFDSVQPQIEKKVHLSLVWDERGHNLIVEDSGSGIPPELQSKIFEPLFSTKPAGEGLSLTLLYRILQEVDGHFEYFTSPLGGAGIKLIFPEGGHA